MSIQGCKECLTLWLAYLNATTACIDLRARQRTVSRKRGPLSLSQRLAVQLDAAEETSRVAKQRALDHQRTQHPGETPFTS